MLLTELCPAVRPLSQAAMPVHPESRGDPRRQRADAGKETSPGKVASAAKKPDAGKEPKTAKEPKAAKAPRRPSRPRARLSRPKRDATSRRPPPSE
ncbi:hypothetical protein GCM10017708_39170 [Arthrobacter citreus]